MAVAVAGAITVALDRSRSRFDAFMLSVCGSGLMLAISRASATTAEQGLIGCGTEG
jgi:hypothetical protein